MSVNLSKPGVNFFFVSTFMLCLGGLSGALPPSVSGALESAIVTEDNMLNGPGDTRKVLMEYVSGNWKEIMDDLQTVAPTRSKRAVIFRAMEVLPPEDYLAYLNKVRDLRTGNLITQEDFETALIASRYKQGFLALNYQNENVQSFIESIRYLAPESWGDSLDNALSGHAKREFEKSWKDEGRGIPENLLLPASTSGPVPRPSKNRVEEPPISENASVPIPNRIIEDHDNKEESDDHILPKVAAGALALILFFVGYLLSRKKHAKRVR